MSLSKNAVANSPTATQYNNLQLAFTYFNEKLFDGELADCLLVFGRDAKNCYGYFHAEQWESKDGEDKCHMISLTPMHLSRPLDQVFGTLVHEMVHLWQQDNGEPSKNGYHNREWADKMIEVGLHPSDTAQPEGKETGPRVSHYIVADGPFAQAFRNMPEEVALPWIGAKGKQKDKKPRNKIKYGCLTCECAAWGKPGLNIVCGDCQEVMEEV